jgi:hypothetical protein
MYELTSHHIILTYARDAYFEEDNHGCFELDDLPELVELVPDNGRLSPGVWTSADCEELIIGTISGTELRGFAWAADAHLEAALRAIVAG